MPKPAPRYKQDLTEAALLLLAQARRVGRAPHFGRRPRIRTSSLGSVDPVVVQRQATLLRYVSITEAFVDATMVKLLMTKLGPPTALLRALVREIEVTASSNWAKRHEAFRRIHGIALKQLPGWKQVDAATNARNSVAHGLGRLTATQRQNRDFATVVGRVGISVSGGQILVDDAALESSYHACRTFISAVDASV